MKVKIIPDPQHKSEVKESYDEPLEVLAVRVQVKNGEYKLLSKGEFELVEVES